MEVILKQLGPFAYLALVVIGFFMVRTLRQVDKNQAELWKRSDDHESRLAHIEGEHEAYTGKGRHPK